MTELEKKIKEAAQAYYTDGSSDLTDDEFDALVDQLKQEQPNSDLLKTGWGYEASLDSTPGQKVKHRYGRAGSLEKCRTWQELGKDIQTSKIDVSLKLDGISVVLYYVSGELQIALTRGDGEIGIDITDKVTKIFPSNVNDISFTGAVRGEILMSYEEFEKFKFAHPEAKNPRNSTAGIINGKDTYADLKYLNLVVYTIVGIENNEINTDIDEIRNKLVEMFGESRVVPHTSLIELTEDSAIETFNQLRNEWYGVVPADGLVLTCRKATINSNNAIEYNAKAFKFAAEQKECEVIEVEWNMSKTRYAVPKIHIKPVGLSGTTVEYCTAYHAAYVRDNSIGPGTVLKIQKRGEIIPNVDEVVKPSEAQMITHCPDCGKELSWNGVHLQCTNPNCSNAIQQDTLIWMTNIAPKDGLGDKLKLKMLDILLDAKLIDDISIESIMNCKASLSSNTESVKQNEFAEMWNDLHTKEVTMVNALLALNVPRIGGVTAIKLSQHPAYVWMLADLAFIGDKTLPLSISAYLCRAIGQANTQAIEDNLWKFERLRYIKHRVKSVSTPAAESRGKVAITGKLSVKRSDFEKELRDKGYTPGDISKDTKFLITDDPNSSSSKNKKADQWGIVKITEEDFRKKYM